MSRRGLLIVGAGLLLALLVVTRVPRDRVKLATQAQTPGPLSPAPRTEPTVVEPPPSPPAPTGTPIPLLETLLIERVTIGTVILGDEWLYFGRGEYAQARIEVRNEGMEPLHGCVVRWGDATPGSGALSEPFALAPGERQTLLMTSLWRYAMPGQSPSVVELRCTDGRSAPRDEPIMIVAGM